MKLNEEIPTLLQQNNSSHPLSILVIDDSASERALLSIRLKKLGHITLGAIDGETALKYLADDKQHFDLILLDVRMPGMDGFETARRIRQLENDRITKWRPILFLSGKKDPNDIAEGIKSGGDDYLTKPVDTLVLAAKITALQRIADMRHQLLEIKRQLEIQAQTDELTKLPNRRHFFSQLESEISRAKRYKTPLSIAYLDLDNFKTINDSYGHEAGDAVLCAVSDALNNKLRSEDSIGRMGGEEFCICLPGATADKSIEPCERYRSLISALVVVCRKENLKVTASFGLTTFDPQTDDSSSLLARADEALYRAKKDGRNCVRVI